ncbi:hypothetical protein F66182_9060 [Fusarium sp. NRRL 66182]|nr:hypothetical protein F66182_9060 [Fusarium sp. NRRL 66182]
MRLVLTTPGTNVECRDAPRPKGGIQTREENCCYAGAMCTAQTEPGKKFCYTHSICAQPGCSASLVAIEGESFQYSRTGGYEWLCPEHSCRTKDGNGQCYKPRRDSNTHYCADHAREISCLMPGCTYDRAPGSRVCKRHTCQEHDCFHQAYQLGRDERKCTRHQPCAAPGCDTHVDRGSDRIPRTFCPSHHSCRAYGGCDAIVNVDSGYCPEHKCNVSGCCQIRDVLQSPLTLWCRQPNEDGTSSPYCKYHACENRACHHMAKFPGGYCVSEACSKDGCAGKRDADHPYLSHLCPAHRTGEGSRYSIPSGDRYVLSSGRYSPSRPRTPDSFGNDRHRPRVYTPLPSDLSRQPRYRDPYQVEEAERRYSNMDREFWRSTPRWMPRR